MKVELDVKTSRRCGLRKIRKMAEAALEALGLVDAELSISLTDDDGIRELNRRYRDLDRPTDVLSFPMDDPSLIGDVVISVERARSQAARYSVSLDREMARLLVHGILHLVGYDHVNGGRQAAKMRRKEEELLAAIEKRGIIDR